MFRRRRNTRSDSNSNTVSVPRERPTNALPPNTPGVQIFGENYSGPRVLAEETEYTRALERNSKIGSVIKSVRIKRAKDPVERLKIQLKELDLALQDGTLDDFEYEEAKRKALEDCKKAIAKNKNRSSLREVASDVVERQADEVIEGNEEVQNLLESNQMVTAVPLTHNASINDTNELVVVTEDPAIIEEPEPAPTITVEDAPLLFEIPEEEPTVQASTAPVVVSAFVVDAMGSQTIVIGDGDFLIETQNSRGAHSENNPLIVIDRDEPSGDQRTGLNSNVQDMPGPSEQAVHPVVESTQGEEEVASHHIQIDTAINTESAEDQGTGTGNENVVENVSSSFMLNTGSHFMFNVSESDQPKPKKPVDEYDELEMLMLDLGGSIEPAKPQVLVDLNVDKNQSQEELEKEQAVEFAFKEENPPNIAKDLVEEQVKPQLHTMQPLLSKTNYPSLDMEDEVVTSTNVAINVDPIVKNMPKESVQPFQEVTVKPVVVKEKLQDELVNDPEDENPPAVVPAIGGGLLFDVGDVGEEPITTDTADVAPVADSPAPILPITGGGFMFSLGNVEEETGVTKVADPPVPATENKQKAGEFVKATIGRNMFLGLLSEDEDTNGQKNVTSEEAELDELALLMTSPTPTKKEVKLEPLIKVPTPENIKKPAHYREPVKKQVTKPVRKQVPKRKLSYKESRQAILSKQDEDEMALLMNFASLDESQIPKEGTVMNNPVKLIDEEASDASDDEMRFAPAAKPVFVTTSSAQPLVKKKSQPKPAAPLLYPTAQLETGSGQKPLEPEKPQVRAFVVRGLLDQMEKEGKTAQQCLTNLKDLQRWGTLSEEEVALGQEILRRTRGFNA